MVNAKISRSAYVIQRGVPGQNAFQYARLFEERKRDPMIQAAGISTIQLAGTSSAQRYSGTSRPFRNEARLRTTVMQKQTPENSTRFRKCGRRARGTEFANISGARILQRDSIELFFLPVITWKGR